jgi:hypothetical protein
MPLQAPNANAHIERWVGGARRECLDRLLIFNRHQLERVLRIYVRHYKERRPHRALDLQARPTRARCSRREASPPDQRRRSADKTCSADSSTNTNPSQHETELMQPTGSPAARLAPRPSLARSALQDPSLAPTSSLPGVCAPAAQPTARRASQPRRPSDRVHGHLCVRPLHKGLWMRIALLMETATDSRKPDTARDV